MRKIPVKEILMADLLIAILAILVGVAFHLNAPSYMFIIVGIFGILAGAYYGMVLRKALFNPVKMMKKALSENGFNIEKIEEVDGDGSTRFSGSFMGDRYWIDVDPKNCRYDIIHQIWCGIKNTDKNGMRILELINLYNSNRSNIRAILLDPDEKGYRYVVCVGTGVIPTYNLKTFIFKILCEMHLKRREFNVLFNSSMKIKTFEPAMEEYVCNN